MKQLEFKGFEGHIILLCKNHYNIKKGLIESLKIIWAIKCGYPYNESDTRVLQYIANSLYKILVPTIENNTNFQEQLHESLFGYSYHDNDTLEQLIYFYCSKIGNIQVKNKLPNNCWETLVILPKPNKRVFNRILRGNGRFEDYKLINN